MKFVLSAVAAVIGAPVVGLSVLAPVEATDSAAAQVVLCATSGPLTGLDATQARNARIIAAVAEQISASAGSAPADQVDAELIALVTAATESMLHDFANPTVPASEMVSNDGDPPVRPDHDSLGLFQQRVSWGPVTARMDRAASTRLFVGRLLAVPGWRTLPIGVAAQTVQQSAYPDRYADFESEAHGWLAQITGSAAAQGCGSDGLPASVPPGSLPPGYVIPADATDAERRAVTFALAQLGKPYVFDAAGPDAFDCSGLTMAAWAAAGVQLPHYTVTQYQLGVPVPDIAFALPGDLIFIPGSDGSLDPPNPQHVGMYIGDGLVIEAPQTGQVVKIVSGASFTPVIGIRHYR